MKRSFEYFCKDYEKIENYEKAKADNFKGWNCHHRLQTHTSDGERRLVNISAAELIALDMYFDRPANELIFLRKGEHSQLHNSGVNNGFYGKHFSEEHRKKLSEANKGKRLSEEHKNKIGEAHKGKQLSEETKKKMSEAWDYDKHFTEETRKKIGENSTGRHWYNNGKINKFCYKCPEGFTPGQLHN